MTVSSKHAKCNQVPSIISGSYSSSFYSTINFGSNHQWRIQGGFLVARKPPLRPTLDTPLNHSGSSLHLNITNDVSSASLDKDRVSSFSCLFDGFISSDFSIVVILILLDSDT